MNIHIKNLMKKLIVQKKIYYNIYLLIYFSLYNSLPEIDLILDDSNYFSTTQLEIFSQKLIIKELINFFFQACYYSKY